MGAGVGHRSWAKIGTQFVKSSFKAQWDNLYKFVEMNKRVDVRNPCGSSTAKTLWKMRDAKDSGSRIMTKPTRRKLNVGSPTFALSEALRRMETWEDVGFLGWREQKCFSCWLSFRALSGEVGTIRCVHLFLCGEG